MNPQPVRSPEVRAQVVRELARTASDAAVADVIELEAQVARLTARVAELEALLPAPAPPCAATVAEGLCCGDPRCPFATVAALDWSPRGRAPTGRQPDAKPDPVPADAPADETKATDLIRLLQTPRYAPPRIGGRDLYERPEMPGPIDWLHVVRGYKWLRDCPDPLTELDINAAYFAALSSALLPHGKLMHSGEMTQFERYRDAGIFLIQAHPWPELDLPNPLGEPTAAEVWVTGATVTHLLELEREGRWPDVAILDSWVARGCRVPAWSSHIRDLRAAVLTTHGRGPEYRQWKKDVEPIFGLMQGTKQPGQSRQFKSPIQRPDWAHTIIALAAANLWRKADKCNKVVPGCVAALVETDVMRIRSDALDAVTSAGAITIDHSGVKLGSFKVQAQ